MAENYTDAQNAYMYQVGGSKETRATFTNDRVCTHREEYK